MFAFAVVADKLGFKVDTSMRRFPTVVFRGDRLMSFAFPIEEVHTLLAGEGTGAIPAKPNAATLGSERLEATAFLHQLADLPANLSFLPDQWIDSTDKRSLVPDAQPPPPDLDGHGARLGALGEPAAVLAPIRIPLRRVELAAPVAPGDLQCTAGPDDRSDPPAVLE